MLIFDNHTNEFLFMYKMDRYEKTRATGYYLHGV